MAIDPIPSGAHALSGVTPAPRQARWLRLPIGMELVLGTIVIALAVWAVYGRSIHAPRIFDDESTLDLNSSIKRVWPLVSHDFERGPLNPHAGSPTSARPVVNLSLAINYYYGELDPTGYRVANIVLHVLVTLLLWAVVRRTLLLDYFQGRFEHTATSLSFAVALVWALHPLVTESVVYITQRTELMMALFYLAVFYASQRYWATARSSARATWCALAGLACVLGMFSKEVLVSAPAMIWLYERTFVAGSFRRALRDSWPLYASLMVGWVGWAVYAASGPRTPLAGFDFGFDVTTWWLTQCHVLWVYLRLAVWPWPLNICYELPLLETLSQAWPWVLATSLLVLATVVLVLRRTSAGFVLAALFAILSPTFVVPCVTEIAVERRMYLPLAGLVALAVIGLYAIVQSLVSRRAAVVAPRASWMPWAATMALAVTLAVVGSIFSARRLVAFDDELTLWKESAALQPWSAMTRANAGNLLARSGRLDESIGYLRDAIKLSPESTWTQYNLGCVLEESGNTREAIHHYREAIRVNDSPVNRWFRYDKGLAAAHTNLGELLAREGKTDQAIAHYEEALRKYPASSIAHNNLAIALVDRGQTQEAIPHFEQALDSHVTIEGYTNLANAYALVGRKTEAIAMAAKAVELARVQGETALADRIETHLQVYRDDAAQP